MKTMAMKSQQRTRMRRLKPRKACEPPDLYTRNTLRGVPIISSFFIYGLEKLAQGYR